MLSPTAAPRICTRHDTSRLAARSSKLEAGSSKLDMDDTDYHGSMPSVAPVANTNCELRTASFELRRGDEATAGAHVVVAVLDLDPNRVPAAVLRARGRVAEVVLLAQLVGDARGRRREVDRKSTRLNSSHLGS